MINKPIDTAELERMRAQLTKLTSEGKSVATIRTTDLRRLFQELDRLRGVAPKPAETKARYCPNSCGAKLTPKPSGLYQCPECGMNWNRFQV